MKQKLLFIFFTISFLAVNIEAGQVDWQKDFETAEKTARQTGKPLMLDFTTEWCIVCRQMDRVFWTRADVIELSEQFVSVRIDGDKFPQIADKFGVRGFPTVVFADGWNAGRDAYLGFGKNGDRVIIDKANQFPKSFDQLKKAGNTLEKNKSKAQGLMDFAEFYRANKLFILSVRIYRDVLKSEPKAEIKELAMLNSAHDFIKLGQPAEALKLFTLLQKDFPESKKSDEFLYGIFYSNLRKNDFTQAETNLAKLKNDFPASTFISQAENLLAKTRKN